MNPFALLLLGITGFLFYSPELLAQAPKAQETAAQRIQRLKYRYDIQDIDGIGELIEPLFAQVVGGEGSNLSVPQIHLIAIAAMKFHLATGDHGQAIVPYLVATHQQTELAQGSLASLVDLVDESFRDQNLPPVFFSDDDLSRFRIQLKRAIEAGECLEDEHSAYYDESNSDQLNSVQKQMVEMISNVRENPKPRDREILKLIDHYISHRNQHRALAHESLATAVEGLKRLDRNTEADRLTSVFHTQFPNSRRLD